MKKKKQHRDFQQPKTMKRRTPKLAIYCKYSYKDIL